MPFSVSAVQCWCSVVLCSVVQSSTPFRPAVLPPGIFPEPNTDPVIQIASLVQRQGEKEPFIRTIFTLQSCASIVGSQVLCFSQEAQLLQVRGRRKGGRGEASYGIEVPQDATVTTATKDTCVDTRLSYICHIC